MLMSPGDRIFYCPIAGDGAYEGKVTAVRSEKQVDIELDARGGGEPLKLRCIAVVPTIKDLEPATCTAKLDGE